MCKGNASSTASPFAEGLSCLGSHCCFRALTAVCECVCSNVCKAIDRTRSRCRLRQRGVHGNDGSPLALSRHDNASASLDQPEVTTLHI